MYLSLAEGASLIFRSTAQDASPAIESARSFILRLSLSLSLCSLSPSPPLPLPLSPSPPLPLSPSPSLPLSLSPSLPLSLSLSPSLPPSLPRSLARSLSLSLSLLLPLARSALSFSRLAQLDQAGPHARKDERGRDGHGARHRLLGGIPSLRFAMIRSH